jgi:hypothetical protein
MLPKWRSQRSDHRSSSRTTTRTFDALRGGGRRCSRSREGFIEGAFCAAEDRMVADDAHHDDGLRARHRTLRPKEGCGAVDEGEARRAAGVACCDCRDVCFGNRGLVVPRCHRGTRVRQIFREAHVDRSTVEDIFDRKHLLACQRVVRAKRFVGESDGVARVLHRSR